MRTKSRPQFSPKLGLDLHNAAGVDSGNAILHDMAGRPCRWLLEKSMSFASMPRYRFLGPGLDRLGDQRLKISLLFISPGGRILDEAGEEVLIHRFDIKNVGATIQKGEDAQKTQTKDEHLGASQTRNLHSWWRA